MLVKKFTTEPRRAQRSTAATKKKKTTSRYLISSQRTIRDRKTGLEWYVGSNKNTSYNEAENWIKNLWVAGGGWRLPTCAELKSLYQKGVGRRNIAPEFKMIGVFVWSSEPRNSSFFRSFDFMYGNKNAHGRNFSYNYRVFAVRRAK